MQAELTEQIGYEKSGSGEKPSGNRRNGKSSKTLRTDQGPMEIAVPRDRDGDFEPRIIGKHQREWRGFDDKILAMYSHGMSTQGDTGDNKRHIQRGRIPRTGKPGDRRSERDGRGMAKPAA
jgi:transposase-like protein